MKTTILAASLAAATLISAAGAEAGTLDDIKSKGFVQCGVSPALTGFSAPDATGTYQGFDVDVCRAIATAVFGDPNKIKFTPLSAKERFTALASGEVDVLSRNTTWTMTRDTSQGFKFAAISYYDGQGFIVRKGIGVKSALELAGATVCTETGTTTELNLADFFHTNKLDYKPVTFGNNDEAVKAYETGRCDVYTTDQSGLYAIRLKLTNPDEHVILPEIISKEPLGPLVRQGDDPWFNVVKWSYFALLTAEELGVTKANVDEMLNSPNPEIRRLLGKEGTFGAGIGLSNDWAYNEIKALGNYGEIFDKDIGPSSPLKIARGLNAQWNKGGLQYAPPIR
ncbi:MAG: amino acid ABC transporter substrate-binding protein [Ancalomicrobiaceae bacterium]|nr:amino acid ABC transporter substrate-binding protein [Ancalomicrobiaceae bacterium]